jgi:sialate O-acetylesterase
MKDMRTAYNKFTFVFTLLIFCVELSFAQIRLPLVFSDNMVLQQQSHATIWGVDKPNTKISVKGSWGKEARTTADANGQWRLKLQTPAAGGPYTLVANGSTRVIVKNILVGEVWLCSGQSNMGMTLQGYANQPVLGSNDAILHSQNDAIRMFTQPHVASVTPLTDMQGNWQIAGPATTGKFSAVAYFFAKKLHASLGVPIGIIHTSWGGSTIETWMDKESLAGFKHKDIPDTVPKVYPHRTPTLLYNAMLHPFVGYTLKGMLWYQGEGNRENYQDYQGMMTTMILAWRKQWQQGDFPFYFAQIAPFTYADQTGAYVREAQLKTMQSVPRTGMAVTMDVGEEKLIHPAEKETVGNRLAYWALSKDYGIPGIAFSGPVYKAMQKTANDRIIVRFDYAGLGFTSFGKPLTGFEIAGEDKVFYPANAIINSEEKNSGITVWSDSVKAPISVRYAFKSWAMGSLYNTQGLPASSFRTDDWELPPAAK